MRRLECVVAGVLLATSAVGAASGPKPNYSGTWVLDKDRSFSNPVGLEQTMAIVHEGDEVRVDATLTTAQGEQKVKETWTLDGKPRPYTPAVANAKGTRRASWMPGDRGVLVVDDIVLETPKGQTTQQVTRKVILSADGQTLTIDYYTDTATRSTEAKRVFNRR